VLLILRSLAIAALLGGAYRLFSWLSRRLKLGHPLDEGHEDGVFALQLAAQKLYLVLLVGDNPLKGRVRARLGARLRLGVRS